MISSVASRLVASSWLIRTAVGRPCFVIVTRSSRRATSSMSPLSLAFASANGSVFTIDQSTDQSSCGPAGRRNREEAPGGGCLFKGGNLSNRLSLSHNERLRLVLGGTPGCNAPERGIKEAPRRYRRGASTQGAVVVLAAVAAATLAVALALVFGLGLVGLAVLLLAGGRRFLSVLETLEGLLQVLDQLIHGQDREVGDGLSVIAAEGD